MSLNKLNEALFASLEEVKNAKNGDIGPTLEKSKAVCEIAGKILGVEKLKVEQGKVLLAAGMVTEIGGVMFQKEDKDAHPKRLN